MNAIWPVSQTNLTKGYCTFLILDEKWSCFAQLLITMV